VKSPSLIWLRLKWPRESSADQIVAAWRTLGPLAGFPVIAEAVGTGGIVIYRLGIPVGRDRMVARQLSAIFPGISIAEDGGSEALETVTLDSAVRVRLSTKSRPLSSDDLQQASRALMTVLAGTARSERLILQWVLGQPLSPAVVPSRVNAAQELTVPGIVDALLGNRTPIDGEQRRALAAKRSEPGWKAVGRLAVKAATESRRRQLLRQLTGALRTLESPGLQVTTRPIRATSVSLPATPWYWPLRLNAKEMATLSSWPIGSSGELPVEASGSRPFAPTRAVARSGRVIAQSSYPGRTRPLALSPSASLRGLHVIGPTGSGKSTTLLNLIVQDLKAGRGVMVIEPKGQLIEDVLARIPDERIDDVVLLDPSDQMSMPVGLNPLASMGRPPELVADQLLGVFHSLHADSWGPRTQNILGSALLTLARLPGSTLCALPPLLADAGFRRRLVQRINDPLGLEPFWAAFEGWSEAERTTNIAPVLNKVTPLLINPRLRAILGQEAPKFEMRQIYTDRKVLLVNLAKGLIGPEAAGLLGSLVIATWWQATLGRSAVAQSRRHPVFVFIDEFQDYLHLPTDLADALSQTRGFGVGLTLAHQHLGQLSPSVQAAVLANARSRLCFQLPAKDARTLAPTGSGPNPEDFTGLGGFECYLQLMADDAVQPWCSGRTLPPPIEISDPGRVRAVSQRQFGARATDVDAAILAAVGGPSHGPEDDLAPRRRRTGGPK
jgi:Type IV secretion-system coupling protein DNA-binding domain